MPARVLIVDDDPTALEALNMRLSEEYFEVATASDGEQALQHMKSDPPDIVLLDIVMPGIDGYEVCERIRSDPELLHVPIVMLSAKSDPGDVVRGLEAGADDYLQKPFEDVVVLARIRSLVRSKLMTDEFRRREQTSNQFGVLDREEDIVDADVLGGRVLVIDDDADELGKISLALATSYQVTTERDPDRAMAVARDGDFDLIVVSLTMKESDGLRLCSHLRTMEETRQTAILVMTESDSPDMLVRALEIGVSDYLKRPVNTDEMKARVRTQIKRKMYQGPPARQLRDQFGPRGDRQPDRSTQPPLHGEPPRYVDGTGPGERSPRRPPHHGHRPISRMSTTPTGMPWATKFSRNLPNGSSATCVASTLPFATAAKNSWWCCRKPTSKLPRWLPKRLRRNVGEEPFEVSADAGSITVTVSNWWNRLRRHRSHRRRPAEACR